MLFDEMRAAAEMSAVRREMDTALRHAEAVRRATVSRERTLRPAHRLWAAVRARLHVGHRRSGAPRWSPM